MTATFVTGVVLAAGASRRLGRPKQLLPYHGATLLEATLQRVRECGFPQTVVTLGGAAAEVREQVDLHGVDVAVAEDFGSGCSASLKVALQVVDPRADGIVLLLGDQPQLSPQTVAALVATASDAPIAVCRYRDGLGHPFWLSRSVFGELTQMHGDKGVWKVVDSGRFAVTRMPVDAPVPLDVDTWADYQRLLAESPS